MVAALIPESSVYLIGGLPFFFFHALFIVQPSSHQIVLLISYAMAKVHHVMFEYQLQVYLLIVYFLKDASIGSSLRGTDH